MINRLDHLVLTVKDIDRTIEFYTTVLEMQVVTFGSNRKALVFGQQKINLHQAGKEFEPKAKHPLSGSADLCFIVNTDLEVVKRRLEERAVPVEEGIVPRTGALGKIQSLYIRDPDGNLIELSRYEA
ncbi:VOC family protein [Ammoniphilus resinae]|uniref:Catechol 2,3-dioxygenase-like lactoylglutathione lyase family enzyme n=1 Tax=Ammoniphilus resinae TaxID=861532 RepID=A0ABS4GTK0_9BACL|nr:catechol 2,3-dioxygenase-like lactoylglutathione lyase family enzyme [Ammoniphilus resinae]